MEHDQEIAGWKAPCGPMDYRAMARAAQQECNALQALLARLEAFLLIYLFHYYFLLL